MGARYLFDCDLFNITSRDFVRYVICLCAPVDISKVQNLERIRIGIGGQRPVNGQCPIRFHPGVSVVLIHQIQVFELILAVGISAAQICICSFFQQVRIGDILNRIGFNHIVKEQGDTAGILHGHGTVVDHIGSPALSFQAGRSSCDLFVYHTVLHLVTGAANGEFADSHGNIVLFSLILEGNQLLIDSFAVNRHIQRLVQIQVNIKGVFRNDQITLFELQPDGTACRSFNRNDPVDIMISLTVLLELPGVRHNICFLISEEQFAHIGVFQACGKCDGKSGLREAVLGTASSHISLFIRHGTLIAVTAHIDGDVSGRDGNGIGRPIVGLKGHRGLLTASHLKDGLVGKIGLISKRFGGIALERPVDKFLTGGRRYRGSGAIRRFIRERL